MYADDMAVMAPSVKGLQKTAILKFLIFFKNAKHKNACISEIMLDRAILTKILIRRVTLLSS